MMEINKEALTSLTISDLIALFNYYDDKLQLKAFEEKEIQDKLVVLYMEIERRANNIFLT